MHARSVLMRWQCAAFLTVILVSSGCGWIADKGRIKIAMLDGNPITRDDLEKVLRNMASDERPQIRTRGDVRKVLENYIDTEIKNSLAEDLKQQGKIFVQRELAAQIYDQKHPDQNVSMSHPEDYQMKESDVAFMKQEREVGIDDEVRQLESEQAVAYRIQEAIKNKTISVTDEEYKKEFDLRNAEMKHFEQIAFRGVYFPSSNADAAAAAAATLGKLHGGETPEDIAKENQALQADVLEAKLANDPRAGKFLSFWQQAAGARTGDVLGPVVIQGWERTRVTPDGRQARERIPDSLLVFQVVEEVPEAPKTLDEAKDELTPFILYAKIMEQLRKDHHVEIYEENLPDPSIYESPTTSTVVVR